MSAPVVVMRGSAAMEGVAGVIDAVISLQLKQSYDLDQQWEGEEIKDLHGAELVWIARNEHAVFDCKLKLVGDTVAHYTGSGTALGVVAVGTAAPVSDLGQPFLKPLAVLTLSAFPWACLNAAFQLQMGSKLTQVNDKTADFNLKLKRYASADQQTAIANIPT